MLSSKWILISKDITEVGQKIRERQFLLGVNSPDPSHYVRQLNWGGSPECLNHVSLISKDTCRLSLRGATHNMIWEGQCHASRLKTTNSLTHVSRQSPSDLGNHYNNNYF